MMNVGISVATAVLALASLDGEGAGQLVSMLEKKAAWRLSNEVQNSSALLAGGKSELKAEIHILELWKTWYLEAVESVREISCDTENVLSEKVTSSTNRIEEMFNRAIFDLNNAYR